MPTSPRAGDPILLRFGEAVRLARERCGFSQEDLGHAAGLHRTYVCSLERGERNVGVLNVYALASALGVPPSALLPTPNRDG